MMLTSDKFDAHRRIATATERDRHDLFVSAARRVGITEQNVEKDFWVCWALDALFHGRRPAAPRLLFKGARPSRRPEWASLRPKRAWRQRHAPSGPPVAWTR
jgi:hypothetical protein